MCWLGQPKPLKLPKIDQVSQRRRLQSKYGALRRDACDELSWPMPEPTIPDHVMSNLEVNANLNEIKSVSN
jgi:hypothetical protein